MATTKEESILEKVQSELDKFKEDKLKGEADLNKELAEAKTEYEEKVKSINSKYNVDKLEEDIKRHTYVLSLLKGEIAIPDDLNAKKSSGKVKVKGFKSTSDESKTSDRVTGWPEKIKAALEKLGKTVADKPAPKDIKAALEELYPDQTFSTATLNSAWVTYKKKN